jgi:phosphate transport system substrate-binding protein
VNFRKAPVAAGRVAASTSEGVSGNIGQTTNSIGYVEYACAKRNELTYTRLLNQPGKSVEPTMEAFQAGAPHQGI